MTAPKGVVFFMAKIAAALIIKDDTEANDLRRCLNSFSKFVDAIYITGTKEPQDEIKKICKEFKANWSYFEWIKDFSAARNFNFSQVPKEYEWIFWCDADDVVVGGENFRTAVDLAEKNDIKAVFARYLYQVEFDETGKIKNILIEHLRERLIRNDGTYKWVAPIHETLIEQVPSNKTDFQGFYVVHMTTVEDMFNAMDRNIDILEDEVMNNPNDPRPIYYLAKAYYDTKIPEILYEPIGTGLKSLTLELMYDYIKKSGWQEERAQCWEYISIIHREMNQIDDSIKALLEAVYEFPRSMSLYIQLALAYVVKKDWENALHYVRLAQATDAPKTTLVVNPRDYKTLLLEAMFHIYLNTGKLELCEKVVNELVNILPTDLNKQRLYDITDLKHRNDLAHWTVKLATHLFQSKQYEQLRALINAIPKEIATEPALLKLRNDFMPPREWSSDEIAIYCGPGFEQWSPKSVARGIGGSEEAVINISRELARLGWKVTVYADPMDDQGIYDGVSWLPYYYINQKDQFNIFIAWRNIGIFDIPFKAKKTYLWNHDIQNPLTYTKERVEKIDKVMFLSNWHRQNVPSLPEYKVLYTGNGINL